MVHPRATIMPYSYSGYQNEQFENLINIQDLTEVENHN